MVSVLFDRYDVLEPIGEGAQSHVYLVRDRQNQNHLKTAKILKGDPAAVRQDRSLVDEFQILADLDHENLVRVYECRYLLPDHTPVLITEFIPKSSSLETYLRSWGNAPLAARLSLAFQIIRALDYLHRKQIVHGDLKPSNILLAPVGQRAGQLDYELKLIDFGVSHDLIASQQARRVGTPYYLAPEVVREGISPASDIYSLGVILYRLLVNPVLPYQGRSIEQIFSRHARGDALFSPADFIEPEPRLRALVEFIRACTAMRPKDRPQDLQLILKVLRFDFPEILQPFRADSPDMHVRHPLALAGPLAIAQHFIDDRCRPAEESRSQRAFLFICGPSGSGKSRFLSEVARSIQQQGGHHLFVPYRGADFWIDLRDTVLGAFSEARASKRMGPALRRLEESLSPASTKLFLRYLQLLAAEIDGLVILIDGVQEPVDLGFLSLIHEFSKYLQAPAGHAPVQLAFLVAVQSRAEATVVSFETPAAQPELVDLLESFSREANQSTALTSSSTMAQHSWRRIPEPIRTLGLEGLAHLVSLPDWSRQTVADYLRQVLPSGTSREQIEEQALVFYRLSGGNPGLLQTLCAESLKQAVPASVLGRVSDLQVHKLHRYDSLPGQLLGIVAACGPLSEDRLLFLSQALLKHHTDAAIRTTLVMAFDDGLVSRQRSGEYAIHNGNLRESLRQRWLAASPEHFLVPHASSSTGAAGLTHRERFLVYEFLGEEEESLHSFLTWYRQVQNRPDRLTLSPYLARLLRQAGEERESLAARRDLVLELKLAAMDLAMLHSDYDGALRLGEEILGGLAFARLSERAGAPEQFKALEARVHLFVGAILSVRGKSDQAMELFQRTLETKALSERDAWYAQGLLMLCQLKRTAAGAQPRAADLEAFNQVRRLLRHGEPIRYAILTANLGALWLDRGLAYRALPYLQLAARVYSHEGDFGRQVITLRRIARTQFMLGNYLGARETVERALPLAARYGMERESLELLVLQLHTLYYLGDLRAFPTLASAILERSHRLGDRAALPFVAEMTALAYLDRGLINQALAATKHVSVAGDGVSNEGNAAEMTLDLVQITILQALKAWTESGELLQKIPGRLERHATEHQRTRNFYQMFLLLQVEQARGVSGAPTALREMQRLIEQSVFQGVLQDEAHLKGLELAVEAQDSPSIGAFQTRCEAGLGKLEPSQRLRLLQALLRAAIANLVQTDQVTEWMRRAGALLSVIHSPLLLAEFQDLKAHVLIDQGEYAEALNRWRAAEREYQRYKQSWTPTQRAGFEQGSSKWQAHLRLRPLIDSRMI